MELLLHLLKALIATFLLMLWVWNATNLKNKTHRYMWNRCTIIWKMGPDCTAKSKAVTQQSSKLRTYYTILLSSYIFYVYYLPQSWYINWIYRAVSNWCLVFFFLFLLFTNSLSTDLNAHWVPKFSTILSCYICHFFCQNSEFRPRNDIQFKLTAFQLLVKKARWKSPLLSYTLIADTGQYVIVCTLKQFYNIYR